ncbi:MAG: TIGR04190 family B12-binding domain/radical SAM domain protein [Methanomassiliicoccaceae archaeon]|jgi:B12-binding domain/radical SAM domain protein|nr:TIGR04190 family B12-binding domain/radical SAM domain protein [Methanomassiliicoccaceae archaeon]
MAADIIFLHAPSVYDFRKKPIFYGPISDVVPSSPVFEMYPIGFMTMSAHLEEAGYRTRIVNLAVRMLRDSKFDAERMIKKLDAKVFAIDLHWMPHAHGSLEIAKIVKEHHPDAVVELGGFTASYFHEELIQRPEVDMVMRGDSTEIPHIKLMDTLTKGGDLSEVPNLTWKEKDGKIRTNGISFVPDDLDWLKFDYGTVIRNVIRHRDVKSALPWLGWDKLPLTSVFTVRGCSHNCAECGGSKFANDRILCRSRPAFRSPEKLAEDMSAIQDYLKAPIFVIGDIRQGGKDYAERLFREIKKRDIRNHLAFELFSPAGEEFYRMAHDALGEYSMEFSPDSHDETVRYALGRHYDNASIEGTIQKAFGNGCKRFDLFYMTGLPEQTRESAMDSAKASKRLWGLVDKRDELFIYNAPFAPFVDPGSRAFEDPERWGYRFFARTLEEHRQLLDNPSWKHVLSYETKWMTRDDIAETSYDAALELAHIEYQCGRLSEDAYKMRAERTGTAREMLRKVDDILLINDARERERMLWSIKEEGERLMLSTVCDKKDLDWETGSIWSNTPRMIAGLIRSALRK